MNQLKALGRWRQFLLLVGMVVIGLAWWQVGAAARGLTVRTIAVDGQPHRFMVPEEATAVPGVLIAHGFSGSQQLMLGYGYALARAGYGVLLWDFAGHGANSNLLDVGRGLQTSVDVAYDVLVKQPEIDAGRVAILGHSMGSGAALQAGIAQPERYQAVIAVSPTGAEVSPLLPRNLLLLAGSLERPFAQRAESLLAAAGGRSGDFARGTARDFQLIDNVEHISILFSRAGQTTAVEWLGAVFDQSPLLPSFDGRTVWYVLHMAAWLVVSVVAGPLLPREPARYVQESALRAPWHGWGLLLAPFAASGLLALLGTVADLGKIGGLLIGGTLGIWFLFLGIFWLAIGFRPEKPALRFLSGGLLLFALLWLACGALAPKVWLPWLLIPSRLWRWPLLSLLLLPWSLAGGYAVYGKSVKRRLCWWLGETVLVIAGLLLTLILVPDLFFLSLILPLVPVVLGLMAVAAKVVETPWSVGTGKALFFAWLILAVFPLSG